MPGTKDKILDAAEKLFAELGIDGASLRAITDAAGVNVGSIYYYFKSKEQFVEEVLGRRIDQFNREGAAQFAAMKKYNLRPSARDAWLMMIGSLLEFRRQHPDYMKFIQHLQVFKEQMLHDALQAKTNEFEEDLKELLSVHFSPKRREEALNRCQLLLQMLYQTVLSYSMLKLGLEKTGITLNDDQIAEQFADIAVGALQEFMER